jgi:aryl-alcohol dehydrogenase-like predicted oxidoreductase
MDYTTLGKGGPRVSEIGLGMWQAGGTSWGRDVRDQDCMAAMARGVELGMNLADTAEVYGNGHSEEVVARAIREVGRDRVFVATKVSGDHLHAADVEKACRGSLRRLRVRAIDLYQIHWPSSGQVPLAETMKALEGLVQRGKIRHIGVSNFEVRDLEEARSALSREDIVSNQIQYSLLHREPEDGLLPYCEREGIAILAWSPIAKGLLATKYSATRRPKDRIRGEETLFKPANIRAMQPLFRVLRDLANAHGKTPAQVALRWLADHPGVVPIPGVKRPAQAEEAAGAAGWALGSPERALLDRTSKAVLTRLDTF